MSISTCGLVHEVLPYFDVLTTYVNNFADDITLYPAVRAATVRGGIILNLYYCYNRTFHSVIKD